MHHDVYVSGPLTDLRTHFPTQETHVYEVYETIEKACAAFGLAAYLPSKAPANPNQQYDEVDGASQLGSAESVHALVYEIDHQKVTKARLVIAYVGLPSLGVGAEIEMCRGAGVPVILVHEPDRRVSRLIKGHPAVEHVVAFTDIADLAVGLRDVLWHYRSKLNMAEVAEEDRWSLGAYTRMRHRLDTLGANAPAMQRRGPPVSKDAWRRLVTEPDSLL